MAVALDEYFNAVALDAFDLNDYWPDFDSVPDLDIPKEGSDGEYPAILLLYETLLDDMLNQGLVKSKNVKRAIEHLVRNHGRLFNGKTPVELNYNDLNNCFGYLHRYAACHTALVRTMLKRIFHVKPPAPIRRLLSLKDSLDIVSLGGGPGNDIIGLCSALYGKHYGILNMNLTVVDLMRGWETVFLKTVQMLRETNLGNVSDLCQEIKIEPSFIEADVTNPSTWNFNLDIKIHNADIILLVKVLSVIPNDKKNNFLQFVSSMKPGAVLIFIDCPFPRKAFSTVKRYLDCVHQSHKETFEFNYKETRFGYPNITSCSAHVRVYKRSFDLHHPEI